MHTAQTTKQRKERKKEHPISPTIMTTAITATRRMLIIATTTTTMMLMLTLLLSISKVDAFTTSSSSLSSVQVQVPRQFNDGVDRHAAATQEVMSEMDLMCLENAADLCSLYDECDLEEREALLTRFQQQTEIMADRIATMQALVKHLKTGDHEHLEHEEVALFTNHILELVDTEVNGITNTATTVVVGNGAGAATTT